MKNLELFPELRGKSGNHGNARNPGNGIPFWPFSNPWGFAKEFDFG